MNATQDIYDLLVIGGGVNGTGVARDAAGRGLSVLLVEQDDLASATSSASSKLVHGGLRYLEHYEFGLVRESLKERAVLLDTAAHIVHPQTFVLPHGPGMRPAWMLMIGLFLYDHLGTPHERLARSRRIDIPSHRAGQALAKGFDTGFVYADCTVDDSRLVVLNAVDAAERGAHILARTKLVSATRRSGAHGNLWEAVLDNTRTGARQTVRARAMANIAGPWARAVIDDLDGVSSRNNVRQVKGSHIVVPRLFEGDHAFILQNDDGRIVFAIPLDHDFTMVGTTEVELSAPPPPGPTGVTCSAEETDYLCKIVNRYFTTPIAPSDVVWSFAGVRPLVQDAKEDRGLLATRASREYAFEFDAPPDGAPLLSVFGGKLTTYRRLAELAVDRLCHRFPAAGPSWTARAPLPGGEPGQGIDAALRAHYPAIDAAVLAGLLARHGTRARAILGAAATMDDLGMHFGHGLTQREVDHMIEHEWAQTADDILWRRSKLGLRFNDAERERLESYVTRQMTENPPSGPLPSAGSLPAR